MSFVGGSQEEVKGLEKRLIEKRLIEKLEADLYNANCNLESETDRAEKYKKVVEDLKEWLMLKSKQSCVPECFATIYLEDVISKLNKLTGKRDG